MKRIETALYFSLLVILFSLPMPLLSQLNTWQQTSSEVDYPVYDFVSKQNTLFAAFYGAGVFKTTNEGQDWTACHTGLSNFLARDIALSGNNLFVGTNGDGVFKSSDSGDSWQAVNDTLINQEIWSLLVVPINGNNRIFAGTSKGLFIPIMKESIGYEPPYLAP